MYCVDLDSSKKDGERYETLILELELPLTVLILCLIHKPRMNLKEVAMANLFRDHIYHRWSSLG